ncbi:MAG: hypothetical protein B7X67_18495 [Rhizobiales bacterium 39-66-18]|jgi:hypothetical protein|nr:MAG: hypothetical protein B7X67_18495 [Rhizobiales bacterium 39-66-18]
MQHSRKWDFAVREMPCYFHPPLVCREPFSSAMNHLQRLQNAVLLAATLCFVMGVAQTQAALSASRAAPQLEVAVARAITNISWHLVQASRMESADPLATMFVN